jgi:hypothetical protein
MQQRPTDVPPPSIADTFTNCGPSQIVVASPYGPYHQAVTVPDDLTDPDDILVVIDHPFGEAEVSLAVWIATGPGLRPFVRPVRARSRSSGRPVPLMGVVPLRYRNDEQSRQVIHDGLLDDPWPVAIPLIEHDAGGTP